MGVFRDGEGDFVNGAVPRKSILGAAPSPRARRDKKVLGNREGGGPARSETQQGHLG